MFASNSSQVSSDAVFIEDVFSTYLYTGNGSTQTITNGIDLAGKGGLVWTKNRSTYSYGHQLFDTNRGAGYDLATNSTAAENYDLTNFSSFNSTGFTLEPNANANVNGVTNVSWTFRKQSKFFDVVTYTGNGVNGRTISHSLGSTPGCIIVKRTDTTSNWAVYHRSASDNLSLNSTAIQGGVFSFAIYSPTSTGFSVSSNAGVNANGGTYVAYIFAHDAGGFGASGADNVITCGSYTGNGVTEGPTISLGYEPQWILIKRATDGAANWFLFDNMCGIATGRSDAYLMPNLSAVENTGTYVDLTATGFAITSAASDINGSDNTFIYIAIRRGPMKTPTSGTSVYKAITRTGTGATATITGAGFPPDMVLSRDRGNNGVDALLEDRLRGATAWMTTTGINAEATRSDALTSFANMDGVAVGADSSTQAINWTNFNYVTYFFRRAQSFMDVVCYSGTGSNTTQTHNLGVTPELIIVKRRGATSAWPVYSAALANTEYLVLNTTAAKATGATYWNSTTPTSTVFSLGTAADVNASGSTGTYVAYLFASCPGVSKVGSYTGSGTTKQIDCGFTGGARFVLIKRTDSTGDWYVWDTARGIVSGNDPYLLLNSTAAEVTNTDYIDAYSAGFEISSTAPAAINASGGTFVFFAIS